MPDQEMENLREAYAAFGRGDVDGLLEHLAPEIDWDATQAIAHTGRFSGHNGVREYISTLSGTWEDFGLEAEEFVKGGEGHAVVLGKVQGRLKGQEPPIEARFAHVVSMRGGKVVRLQILLDRESAMQELERASSTGA
jgi:ketosteroid isomerase-like protein